VLLGKKARAVVGGEVAVGVVTGFLLGGGGGREGGEKEESESAYDFRNSRGMNQGLEVTRVNCLWRRTSNERYHVP
jgi:hypothetical protein